MDKRVLVLALGFLTFLIGLINAVVADGESKCTDSFMEKFDAKCESPLPVRKIKDDCTKAYEEIRLMENEACSLKLEDDKKEEACVKFDEGCRKKHRGEIFMKKCKAITLQNKKVTLSKETIEKYLKIFPCINDYNEQILKPYADCWSKVTNEFKVDKDVKKGCEASLKCIDQDWEVSKEFKDHECATKITEAIREKQI